MAFRPKGCARRRPIRTTPRRPRTRGTVTSGHRKSGKAIGTPRSTSPTLTSRASGGDGLVVGSAVESVVESSTEPSVPVRSMSDERQPATERVSVAPHARSASRLEGIESLSFDYR
ncbi:hypothetical protein [Haladaptatus halobius]|uniref:hypothetical protein n=1 Tax=Haladaptatus halobius TaxID=2884875 RepID=UPI001D09B461|nr:hypothetical protein [Haladaptatus halobius]